MHAASPVEKAIEDHGRLVNNNTIVESLRTALIGGKRSESMVPMCLDETIREGAWADRQDLNSRRFRCKSFVEFIEKPEPEGLGTTKDAIRKYLGDSNSPLRVRFEELAEVGRGSPTGNPEVPRNPVGKFTVIHPDEEVSVIPNNIRDNGEDGRSRDRDRSREPQAGDSVGYAVRRLQREAERDPMGIAAVAYEQLQSGRVTAHKAMVQAGLKDKAITIPADPLKAARRLTLHFTREQFADLVAYAYAEYERKENV